MTEIWHHYISIWTTPTCSVRTVRLIVVEYVLIYFSLDDNETMWSSGKVGASLPLGRGFEKSFCPKKLLGIYHAWFCHVSTYNWRAYIRAHVRNNCVCVHTRVLRMGRWSFTMIVSSTKLSIFYKYFYGMFILVVRFSALSWSYKFKCHTQSTT